MRIIHSATLYADVKLDLCALTVEGFLYNCKVEPFLVRLLLPVIGVEAGTMTQTTGIIGSRPAAGGYHFFRFEGDIVQAALWLGEFQLVKADHENSNNEVPISPGFFESLSDNINCRQYLGRVAVRGNSWLLSNRFEFASHTPDLSPNPGDLPIFGVMASGFGDTGWFDRDGAPSGDYYLGQIPRVFQAMAAKGRLIILIDMSNEGQPLLESWVTLLHEGLERRHIPAEYCVLLQQNRRFDQQYATWATDRGIVPMRTFVYDYYPRRMVGRLSHQDLPVEINNRLRNYKFCCLNFTPRPSRTSLVSWLLAKKYDSQGLISFTDFANPKSPSDGPILCEWFPEIETVRQGLKLLCSRMPLVLDLDTRDKFVPEFDLGTEQLYADTYFSIVTETDVSDGDVLRITEKVIKPLAMFHPIILLGNPHSLKILKDYGFKTFQGFFDETYDTIEDPVIRVRLVLAEIDRLLSLESDQLHKLYFNYWSTLAFNVLQARRVLHEKFKYDIEPSLLDNIVRKPPSSFND